MSPGLKTIFSDWAIKKRKGNKALTSSGYLAGCVISLFFHELGHICTARALGIQVKRIGISWRGPYLVREAGTPTANAIVSAAGPLVNLLLSAILWHVWPTGALVNLVLGLANLVPTSTSDGGRLWRGLTLAHRYGKSQVEQSSCVS